MRLASLYWRRARLLGVVSLLFVSELLKLWGEDMLSALEGEVGISKPAPFRWSDYKGQGDE